MEHERSRTGRVAAVLAVVVMMGVASGCASSPPAAAEGGALGRATQAYEAGDYPAAYRLAAGLTGSRHADEAAAASYLAGISAERLDNDTAAERHFKEAIRRGQGAVAADARASLGLIYHRQGRYEAAAAELTRAAHALTGEPSAKAHFYAGIALQKLDRWQQAQTSLLLARAATHDPELREQINDRLAVTGYTVQIGAFGGEANARRAAEAIARRAIDLRLGAPVLVPAVAADGSRLTLVQVGRFASFDAARRAREQLAQPTAIIVPLAGR